MIKIKTKVDSIEVTGHANAGPKGKDIVCAGVSAIVMGSINWFSKKDIMLTIDESTPQIIIRLKNKNKKNQELIKLLTKQLKVLAKSNKQYITI